MDDDNDRNYRSDDYDRYDERSRSERSRSDRSRSERSRSGEGRSDARSRDRPEYDDRSRADYDYDEYDTYRSRAPRDRGYGRDRPRREPRDSRDREFSSEPRRRKRHFHERDEPVDHQGLSASGEEELQDQVLYEVKEEASFHVTRALFIANLRRPLNAIHFQQYLRDLAEQGGGYSIERAWLNRTRSHGIVLVDKEEGAAYIREKLVGTVYPSPEEDEKLRVEYEAREVERYEAEMREFSPSDPRYKTPLEPRKYVTERHPLYVDYIPVKAINQWVFEEDKGARNGKWKIDYERKGDDVIATHTLLNGSFIPRYNPSIRRGGRERERRRDFREPRRERRGYTGYGEEPRPYNMYPPRERERRGYNRGDYGRERRRRSRSRSRSRSPYRG